MMEGLWRKKRKETHVSEHPFYAKYQGKPHVCTHVTKTAQESAAAYQISLHLSVTKQQLYSSHSLWGQEFRQGTVRWSRLCSTITKVLARVD